MFGRIILFRATKETSQHQVFIVYLDCRIKSVTRHYSNHDKSPKKVYPGVTPEVVVFSNFMFPIYSPDLFFLCGARWQTGWRGIYMTAKVMKAATYFALLRQHTRAPCSSSSVVCQ